MSEQHDTPKPGDEEMLARIESALSGGTPHAVAGSAASRDSQDSFFALLAASAPQADDRFQSSLLARLQAEMHPMGEASEEAAQADTTGRPAYSYTDARRPAPLPGQRLLLPRFGTLLGLGQQQEPRRVARLAFGLAGALLTVVVLVGMAFGFTTLLKLRRDAGLGNGTPTPGAVQPGDTLKLVPYLQPHTLQPEPLSDPNPVPFAAWSPDGRTLAVAGKQALFVWDAPSGRLLYSRSVTQTQSLAWSPDGRTIAVSTFGDLSLFDGATGQQRLAPVTPTPDLSVPPGQVATTRAVPWSLHTLAWSPDSRFIAGRSLVPVSRQLVPAVTIWDAATGKTVRNLGVEELGGYGISALAWSPDGRMLAESLTVSVDLWNPMTGEKLRTIQVGEGLASDIFWSPDSRTLAMQLARKVRLADVSSGAILRTMPESVEPYPSPVPTWPGTVLRPVPTGQPRIMPTVPPFTPSPFVPDQNAFYDLFPNGTIWSPDGRTLATTDGWHVRVWDASSGQLRYTITTSAEHMSWSPDGSVLASTGSSLQLWDASSGALLRTLPLGGPNQVSDRVSGFVAWSPDGRSLATGIGWPTLSMNGTANDQFTIWQAEGKGQPTPPPAPTATSVSPATQTPAGVKPAASPAPPTGTTATATTQTATPSGEKATLTPQEGKATTTSQPAPSGGWTVVSVQQPGLDDQLLGVAAISGNDVWAVGYTTMELSEAGGKAGQRPQHSLAMHWDGSEWRVMATPGWGRMYEQLSAVSAASSDDVWAVGESTDGTGAGSVSQAISAHWDGSEWWEVPVPQVGKLGTHLTAVLASGPGVAWAVGYYDEEYKGDPNALITSISKNLILRWDGSAWQQVQTGDPAINPGPYRDRLYAIAPIAEGGLWAVGQQGSSGPLVGAFGYTTYPLVLHWDGSAWSVVDSPHFDDKYGQFKVLTGVSASAMHDAWAVGAANSEGSSESIAMHWDGKSWSQVDLPVPVPPQSGPPPQNHLAGVVDLDPANAWAVGAYTPYDPAGKQGSLLKSLIMHWDGKKWEFSPGPDTGAATDYLNAVSALPSGEMWAVGGKASGEQMQGAPLVLRYR